jgi:hypothetical protein
MLAQQVVGPAQLEDLDLAHQLHAGLELAQFDDAIDQGVLGLGHVAFHRREQQGGAIHGEHQCIQGMHELRQVQVRRPRIAH